MKTCTKCGVEKPAEEFYPRKLTRQGNPTDARRGSCRQCHIAKATRWNKENPAKAAASIKQWQQNNWAHVLVIARKWQQANPKNVRRAMNKWRIANPGKLAANKSRYLAQQLRATPAWANQSYIEDVYRKAAIFTKRDGTPWHVDNIVPLQSKLVCGLHCEDNLQALRGKDNMSKGNRQWPDMLSAVST